MTFKDRFVILEHDFKTSSFFLKFFQGLTKNENMLKREKLMKKLLPSADTF